MENGPFINDVPIKTSIYNGFSIAMLNNQRVNSFNSIWFHVFLEKLNSPMFTIGSIHLSIDYDSLLYV